MKIIILNSKLKEGLSYVERAVTESGNLPILKNVLLKTQNNKIKISTTNLELGITCFVFGKILKEGSVTVQFNTLYKIVNNITSERITLEVQQNTLELKTDNYEAKIQGAPSEEFPIIPRISNKNEYIEIESGILNNALLQVVYSAQISEIRPEISGVLFNYEMPVIKLTATDTFRLAEKTINQNQFYTTIQKGFKVIIPLKTINEVMRIFNKDEKIKILFDENQVMFVGENREIISRLIDGEYPDYEAIIPKEVETEITLNREECINAIRLVSNFSGKIHEIKIRPQPDKKSLEIYSFNQQLGENKYHIPISLTGNIFKEIAFNWRYVLDGLKAFIGEEVVFGVSNENKPSIIKNKKDASFFYIVMPIRI